MPVTCDALGLLLREGVRLTVRGLVAGSLVGLVAARVVTTMLVNISPADPLTFVSLAVFLELVAALAGYLPALRATRVDPIFASSDLGGLPFDTNVGPRTFSGCASSAP